MSWILVSEGILKTIQFIMISVNSLEAPAGITGVILRFIASH